MFGNQQAIFLRIIFFPHGTNIILFSQTGTGTKIGSLNFFDKADFALKHVKLTYVRTADGGMLAFSMIANNCASGKDAAEDVQNRALQRLARFSRKLPAGGQ
jgi:hypothetical protein